MNVSAMKCIPIIFCYLCVNHCRRLLAKKQLAERLERAIGVIYRPETELQSHYFYASLPRQFDEYIWFDETRAVEALTRGTTKDMPDTFPFGL
jgi:protein-L-isoaspartate(D-aspartate) O-methyltransferase